MFITSSYVLHNCKLKCLQLYFQLFFRKKVQKNKFKTQEPIGGDYFFVKRPK